MVDVSQFLPILIAVAGVVGLIVVIAIFFQAFYYKVEQGTAMIVNDMSPSPKVHFTGAFVYPIIYKKELMRISLITLEVDRRGKDGLICADNMRADITVAFYLRVNETTEDVLKVAKSIGANRASDREAVNTLFNAKFSEALKTVGKQIEFVKLFENRQGFREKIIEVIGNDLNGYVLEDVAIDYLEQTPKASLDPNNILDSEGIKKITELTAEQNVRTNILERDEELAIKKKNVETTEAMLELERQQADAEAKQEREVATIKAREEAETKKVQEEERLKAETAKIKVDQDLSVQNENLQREVEVAEQNRQRAVAIEIEKVNRARDLEIVAREREVDIQKIEAEKAVEIEKKEIANVIRERVVVDKTVAVEEERINEVREVSQAEREKQIRVLDAEAKAEEEKIRRIKAAEAEEQSAKHKAEEIKVVAEAKLEASAKDADAKIKLAEGIKAEQAATGLAAVEVKQAQALADEKIGIAEANVIKAKGDAQADALRGTGMAEAEVITAKGEAQAKADKEIGLSNADVTREMVKAEAEGLVEKFDAMNTMSDEARKHEEYRMGLETALKEALASIDAGKDIAKENAEVLSTALQKAKIDIVGGEDHFFNNFAKSLSIGKAIDGLADKSGVISTLIDRVVQGKPLIDVDKKPTSEEK
ncbi:flotillin family protein [Sessilibacter corallicola]|uniref:Flotillin family protein n=1 Tax=Sessilibacter corallicola TaxID=2904075 RepID=A0ABQ0A8Y2_9GAMM